MRVSSSLLLIASSGLASLLLVFLTNIASSPPKSPLIGFYEKVETRLQEHPLDIDVLFVDWGDPDAASKVSRFLNRSSMRKRVPLLTLEPHPNYLAGRNSTTLLSDVLAGKHDNDISSLRSVLASYRGPILLRLAHEMDIDGQYPWSFEDPEHYISMFRYVHQKLGGYPLAHVRWVWSPAGRPGANRFWPGDPFVDVIGISAYAARAWTDDRSLESLSEILARTRWLQRRFRRPLLIAEAGVSGTPADQQRWIKDALLALPRFPEVCGLVYFQAPQPSWMPLPTGPENWSLQKRPLDWLLQRLPLPARRGLSCIEA
jgi:hypothetical protein